jgi:hypothetical protein
MDACVGTAGSREGIAAARCGSRLPRRYDDSPWLATLLDNGRGKRPKPLCLAYSPDPSRLNTLDDVPDGPTCPASAKFRIRTHIVRSPL